MVHIRTNLHHLSYNLSFNHYYGKIGYLYVCESNTYFVPGTAHCANMYPPADTDLPVLKAARERISSLIGQWLQES